MEMSVSIGEGAERCVRAPRQEQFARVGSDVRHVVFGKAFGVECVAQIDMSDSIGMYLNDIGKVALLNAEEERELSKIIEAGRDAAERLSNGERSIALRREVKRAAEAKDRFIRANLRLVVSIARKYPLPQGM